MAFTCPSPICREDAVQYFCAKSIEADLIITDNIKVFQNLGIEVMSAKEFFDRFIGL